MPRVRLNPKFTYDNEKAYMLTHKHDFSYYNGNLWRCVLDSNNNILSCDCPIYMPTFNFPTIGSYHSNRTGNRITVTSIRFKCILNMNPDFLNAGAAPFKDNASTTPFTTPAPDRFFKMRYMVIQVDDDLASNVDTKWIYEWFHRTYCWFTQPSATGVDAKYTNAPVSVHANVLHETTPFVAKFNILCDKCFTLTSKKPQISFDITVPLNKEFCWEEENPSNLLYPHLFMFILPPMNALSDLDPITCREYRDGWSSGASEGADGPNLVVMETFTKLNFVDL